MQRLALPLILLFGLVLRAGYLAELRTTPDFAAPLADAAFHDYWAKALISGDWTGPDGVDPGVRNAPYLRPPGYPYFLATIYQLCGGPNYVAVRVVQMGLGLASCVLAYSLARRMFGFAAGCGAGLLLAWNWAFVYYEGELQEPAILVFLTLAVLRVLQGWLTKRAAWKLWVAGALLGLNALFRPNILLVCPFIAGWVVWVLWKHGAARRLFAQVGALTAGALLLVLPATIRNLVVAHEFVLISCNGAVNFYIGNNERADGWAARIPDLKELTGADTWSWFLYPKIVRGVEKQLGRAAGYSDVSSYFNRRAWEFIRANPGRALSLAFKRAALFWGPLEVANNKEVHFERWYSAWLRWMPGFPLVASLAALGLILLLLDRRARPVAAKAAAPPAHRPEMLALLLPYILVYFGSFVPFLAAERFRVTVTAVLAILGGHAVQRIAGWIGVADWRRTGCALAGAAALFGVFQLRLTDYEPQLAGYLVARGDAYATRKDWPAAAREYRRCVEAKPTFLGARDALAGALIELKRPGDALAVYQERLAFQPRDTETLDRIGQLQIQLNQLPDAERTYRAALEADPKFTVGYLNLGYTLNQLQHYADAAEVYRRALAIAPAAAEAQYGLGIALAALHQDAEAETAYRAAIAANPKYVEALVNLGALRAARRDPDGAIALYRRALEIEPGRFEALYLLSAALYAKGDRQAALDAIRQALQVQPDSPQAQAALHALEAAP